MNLLEAIIEKVRPDGIPTFGGDPGSQDYPFVTVDILSGRTTIDTNTPAREEQSLIQVTVSSLSPAESEDIGVEVLSNLLPESGPIVWDSGIPGREITRWHSDTRQRHQTEVAPGGMTIHYFEVDIVMLIQR